MGHPGKKTYGKKKLSHRRKWTNQGFNWRQKRYKGAIVGVAEGDSWFDYSPAWFEHPTKGDLLAHLMQMHGKKRYNIYRVSEGGDTLDDMASESSRLGKGGQGVRPEDGTRPGALIEQRNASLVRP